jgi:hypothetical protein
MLVGAVVAADAPRPAPREHHGARRLDALLVVDALIHPEGAITRESANSSHPKRDT